MLQLYTMVIRPKLIAAALVFDRPALCDDYCRSNGSAASTEADADSSEDEPAAPADSVIETESPRPAVRHELLVLS